MIASALVACTPKARLYFDRQGISDERWARHGQECRYEALKATASAPPRAPTEFIEEDLYIRCMELKGGRFVRRETVVE